MKREETFVHRVWELLSPTVWEPLIYIAVLSPEHEVGVTHHRAHHYQRKGDTHFSFSKLPCFLLPAPAWLRGLRTEHYVCFVVLHSCCWAPLHSKEALETKKQRRRDHVKPLQFLPNFLFFLLDTVMELQPL